MCKLHKNLSRVHSLGSTAIKHSCVYDVGTHNCGFNASLPQSSHLKINWLCKTNCCKFTSAVICKMNKTLTAVKLLIYQWSFCLPYHCLEAGFLLLLCHLIPLSSASVYLFRKCLLSTLSFHLCMGRFEWMAEGQTTQNELSHLCLCTTSGF